MSFAGDLQKFADKTGIRMDQVVRKVAFDLDRDLVKACPVDTGMARSNFFIGLDRISSVETEASKNGAPSVARAAAFTSTLKAGGTFYITNNLPYILKIMEYGSSDQMASGGLTRIVARWQQIVDKAAALGSRSSRVAEFRGAE